MSVYLTLLLCSIWQLYNFFGLLNNWPLIALLQEKHYFLQVLVSTCTRWSLVFGVFGVATSIVCLIFNKRIDTDMHTAIFRLRWFYVFWSFVLLL